jgi:predicted nucleotidyltransferase
VGSPIGLSELSKKISSVADKYGIVYAIVFGSAVEGRYVEGESDVDVAVKLKKIDKNGVYSFLKSFTGDLNLNNVDVVIVNFAPFSLVFDILGRGRVIFCKDEDELFEDRLRAIKMYDDWLNFSRYFIEREVKKVARWGEHPEEVRCGD